MDRTGEAWAKVVPIDTIRSHDDRRRRATALDQIAYISDLLDELRAMAVQARAAELADMLATARREAVRLAKRSGDA